jgi:Heme/copper-type cytochrome/quinol oxidase, subunit 3
LAVQKGLNIGIILFIVSEALFFLAIFWAFFHSAMAPSVELGGQWPPLGIEPVNPFELPLLNTVILLSSGATITYGHHSLIHGDRKGALYGTIATVLLAIIFTVFQGIEYNVSSFTISDGAFGTCFFFGTGFHGFNCYIFNNVINRSSSSQLYSNKRFYSTMSVERKILSPYWVTGFADAESSFSLKVSKKSTSRSGWHIIPEFRIELHNRDSYLLREIHAFFGVGIITEIENKNKVVYSVQSRRDLTNAIIPHFDQYPLITQKKADYFLFKQAVEMLCLNAQSDIRGVQDILSLKAAMNKGLSDKLNSEFCWNVIPAERPTINFERIPDPNWLAGFVDGEGCFYINTKKAKGYITGYQVIMTFSISQHVRDELLLRKFIDYLNCGNIEKVSTRPDGVKFIVYKFSDIRDKIIPFFQNYPLHGMKSKDFRDFCEIAKLMENKSHLTLDGFKKIKSLKSGMNRGRM